MTSAHRRRFDFVMPGLVPGHDENDETIYIDLAGAVRYRGRHNRSASSSGIRHCESCMLCARKTPKLKDHPLAVSPRKPARFEGKSRLRAA
jgi:hypothetical protein